MRILDECHGYICILTWCFNNLVLANGGCEVTNALLSYCAVAVSDGLYKTGIGTAAWILEGGTEKKSMQGTVHVPSSAKKQDSYQSEATGLFCIILAVTRLV